MSATPVILTGHIDVPAGRLAAIRSALPEHTRLTRAEPGCLSFEVTESATLRGRFDVSERFSDAASFEAHQARVKASDWGRISAGIPRSYTVSGLEK